MRKNIDKVHFVCYDLPVGDTFKVFPLWSKAHFFQKTP